MDINREREFMAMLWKFIQKHRKLTKELMDDGDKLILAFPDISYSLWMVKAYIDALED